MTGDSRWGDGEMEKSGGTGEVNNLINYQLSTINYQLSIINYQLSCPVLVTLSPFLLVLLLLRLYIGCVIVN
ncbi:MAG: hypothetical protein ACKPCP_07020, partial [Sphaerospermopsis kisseleviana]